MLNISIPKVGFTWQGDGNWRSTIFLPYIFNRDGWKCWVLDCYQVKQLSCHESLITRGDVQGWQPKARRILIFHIVNCITLCDKHHNTELEPRKQDVLEWICQYYGKDFVYGWLTEISKEFKIVPPFIREVLRKENQ